MHREKSDQTIINCLQVKLAHGQVLLLFCQVTVHHFVFKHGHVVAALVHQRRILIGHFQLPPGDEEGLLLSQAAQRAAGQAPVDGSASADHCVAVIHRLQVVLHRGGYGRELPAPAQLTQDVDGGAHQQSQRHQAEGDGGDEGGRGVAVGGRFRGRQDGLDGILAARAHEARRALADRAREVGVARAAVVAGELVAGAGAHRAVLAGEAQRARAGEVVDAVHAGAGVAAGVAGAVVDVGLAARAGEAGGTAAHDTVAEVQTLSP